MDGFRGHFVDRIDQSYDADEYDSVGDESRRDVPPSSIGQDERRMQVRAYNFWAGLLQERNFPAVEDLDPERLPDFGPYSVLLDFTNGIENPAVAYLGDLLAAECGAQGPIRELDDVPSRSLLSRITDHYMQILANQAPIGFEAEFVNQREKTIAYRGILLPFSSDDDTIDFIYGVINWKELADQKGTDALLLEVDQALDNKVAPLKADEPLTAWADGPAELGSDTGFELGDGIVDLGPDLEIGADRQTWPEPAFGAGAVSPAPLTDDALDLSAFESDEVADFASLDIPDLVIADEDMALADWLDSARELARAAQGSEDRTRSALYSAIGRAYDFSLAAAENPEDFNDLVADAGLTMQERAPLTPVVKLVFGAEYDKTRLTEYAAALSHAHRLELPRGSLTAYLASAPGGLKGVVNEERRLRRADAGKDVELRDTPREALARKLRKLDHAPFDALPADGSEFTLLIARRLPEGEIVLLGEVDDVPLLERAAKRLID